MSTIHTAIKADYNDHIREKWSTRSHHLIKSHEVTQRKKIFPSSCKQNHLQCNITGDVRWSWAEILVNNWLDSAQVNMNELEIVRASTIIKEYIINSQKHLESLCTPVILSWAWIGFVLWRRQRKMEDKVCSEIRAPKCNSAEMYYTCLCHTVPLACQVNAWNSALQTYLGILCSVFFWGCLANEVFNL